MTGIWQRLKQRKIVQWATAYVAFAFSLIQVVSVVADSYDWPHLVMHLMFGALIIGFAAFCKKVGLPTTTDAVALK